MRKPLHPAEQYARDAARGRIVVGKWAKLAAKRHLDDLKHAHERGFWFDIESAQRVLDFFGLLRHSKGEWAGQKITLEPWQQFVLWVTFGWQRDQSDRWVEKMPDGRIQDTRGMRRFSVLYLEVARKNGKSTLAAGIALYMMLADREGGPEVYAAATKKDQALITFTEAERMVSQSPALKKRVRNYKHNLHIPGTACKFEPLGADSDTMDGLNTYCAIVDELHAHKHSGVWDKLKSSTSARRQPLMVAITTAGNDRSSFCYEMHNKAEMILSGRASLEDGDTEFCIIYSLDEGDDWDDETKWAKSNPNLGVSKYWKYIREEASNAKLMPSALNSFRQLDLNIWVQASVAWVPMDHWAKCAGPHDCADFEELLEGRECYGGLDLSSTSDLCAFVLDFPPMEDDESGKHWYLARFWCPSETVMRRSKSEGVKYDVWVEQGFITATAGNVIDYKYILAQIEQDAKRFRIKEVAYDRYGAPNIVQTLQDDMDITVVQMGQGYLSMSAPMKEVERLIKSHGFYHGNNDVFTWMAGNVVARMDPVGNLAPDKRRSKEKIDGITAMIMATARATSAPSAPKKSVYEKRGIIRI
jgi:phage terminase large subunit-like protein